MYLKKHCRQEKEPSYTIFPLHRCVAVRKLQVVIVARSFREISQTVHINCQSFLSRVRISVRPSKFSIGENEKKKTGTYLRSVTNAFDLPNIDH